MTKGASRQYNTMLRAKLEADAAARGEPLPPLPGGRHSRNKHLEDDEQETLFQQWVPLHLVRFPALGLLHAVPNGGTRVSKIDRHGRRYSPEAARMVRQGSKPGIPDLDLPVPRKEQPHWESFEFIGLRIEMKRQWAKGTRGARKPATSLEQEQCLSDLQDVGHCCCVCYGWEQAAESILAYLTGNPVPHQWDRDQ